MELALDTIAETVRAVAMPLLLLDTSSFAKLDATHLELCEQLIEEFDRAPFRRKADAAWKKKDFVKVVELYESIIDYLSEVELKKLDYARRHMG